MDRSDHHSLLKKYKLNDQSVKSAYGDYILTLYFCDSRLLSSLRIINWKSNRPSDEARVAEVAKDISASGRVQGIIALAQLDKRLVCYDGNHRRLALSDLEDDYRILLTVIWDATHDNIVDEYEALNKSVSVPLIYMPKAEKKDGDLIARFCRELVEQYPTFMSASKVCKSPNFNRDILADDILDLCEEYIDTLTAKEVIANIKKMNTFYKEGRCRFKKDTLTIQVLHKCRTEGLWLFCRSRRVDRSYFELVLNS